MKRTLPDWILFLAGTSLVIWLLIMSVGCVSYRHSRNARGVKESTTVVTVFQKGAADVVSSKVSDGNYSREVGIERLRTSADANGIKAAGGAAGEAAKTFVK